MNCKGQLNKIRLEVKIYKWEQSYLKLWRNLKISTGTSSNENLDTKTNCLVWHVFGLIIIHMVVYNTLFSCLAFLSATHTYILFVKAHKGSSKTEKKYVRCKQNVE